MKKGYIIMAAFFLIFAGGIYGVFVQYVMPMRQELTSLEKSEQEFLDKIDEMKKEFDGSRPEEYIRQLEAQKVPWKRALDQRTDYFKLEEVEAIEMPEDVIPRFWYREFFPTLEESVYELARERGIQLMAFSFGERRPDEFGPGTNPSREEILEEVNKYNYGIEMTKFIMDANPKVITNVTLWPDRQVYSSRNGDVTFRTTGYEISIMWEDLMLFLQRLANNPTFITVEGIKITDRTLRNDRDPVTVQLIVTEAQFTPPQTGVAGVQTPGGTLTSVFGGGGTATQLPSGGGIFSRRGPAPDPEDEEEEEESGGGLLGFFKGLFGN